MVSHGKSGRGDADRGARSLTTRTGPKHADRGASSAYVATAAEDRAPHASLFDSIAVAAQRSTQAIAIVVPGERSVTYGELLEQISETTARYEALGLAKEERVALVAPQTVATIVGVLALSRLTTVVPLNPAYTSAELRAYLEAARATVLVAEHPDARYTEQALSVRVVLPGPVALAQPPSSGIRPTRAALLFQTSGTTARPKNVPLSHRNVLAGAANVAQALGLTPSDVCLVMMPLHHVHGLVGCALATLASGGRLILPSIPRAVDAFGWLNTETPTWYSGSPAIHHAMIARARAEGSRPVHALRLIRSASAPLPTRLIEELRDTFATSVVNAYGMTEGSHQIASTPLEGCERDGDVGFAIGCEVIARRDDGSRAEPGEVADIWIRGENVTAGYEPADDSLDSSGWLRTGDVGTVDERGRVCLRARKKELINKGGEKISPSEIDAALLSVPGVLEAGAFGVPDARLGEDVAAAIVARPGMTVTPETVRAALAGQLATFKVPSRIFLVAELPKGPTGKLLRRRLVESLSVQMPKPGASRTEAAPWSIEDALVGLWKEILQVDHVAPEDDFFELGGDSLSAAELVFAVSERFGKEPSLTAFFAAPTVADLARSIRSEGVDRGQGRALVPLRSAGPRPPLFLVHGTAFSVDHYRTLVRHLPTDIPVFGVQEDLFKTPPYVPPDLETLGRHYAEVIRAQQPHGPYRLVGYSSGGVIATEIARALLEADETIESLVLIDAYPSWLWGTWTWFAYRLRTFRVLTNAYRVKWLSDVIRTRVRRARNGAAAQRGDLGRSLSDRVARLSSNMERIAGRHRPAALDVSATLLVSAESQLLWGDPYLHWTPMVRHLDKIVVPGTHYNVIDEPHAAQVADALAKVLLA